MNKLRILLFCLLALTFLLTPLYAQKPKPKDFGIKSKKALNFYLDGRQQMRWRTYDKAIEAFEEAVKLEPEFAEARLELGQIYVVRNRFEEAVPHLEFAAKAKPGYFGGIEFYLGQAYFFTEQYEKAIPQLEEYMRQDRGGPSFMLTADINLRKARYAAVAIQHPVPFTPVNLGKNVNSEGHEFMPSLTADGQTMLFIARKEGCIGGFSKRLNDYPEDMYMAKRKPDGSWGKAVNLGPPLNTEKNEGAPTFSQDGQLLYFTGCNREDGLGNCDIYVSEWTGNGWSEAKKPR